MKSKLGIVLAAFLFSSVLAFSQSVGADVDKAADKTADATNTLREREHSAKQKCRENDRQFRFHSSSPFD